MQVKGQVRQANHLANHLLNADNNEEIRTLGGFNLVDPYDIHDSVEAMRATAGTNLRSVLHLKINPEPDIARKMTDDDWHLSASIVVNELGLEQHQVAMVLHTKNDRPHLHIAVGMSNLDTDHKYRDFKQFRKNERCQRQIIAKMPHLGATECRRGHNVSGNPRPGYQRSGHDYEQELRTGISAAQVEFDLRGIWQKTKNNAELFRAVSAERGLILARGDKAIVVIDQSGGIHGLGRRLGLKKREVEDAFADLDLPAAADVRGHHSTRPDNLTAAQARARRPARRHAEALRHDEESPGVAAGLWSDADHRAWGRRQFLRRRARELGLEIDKVPDAVTGVFRGKDGLTRLHLSNTRETIRVTPERVTIHSRGPGLSDPAIAAMLDVAQAQGWQSVTLTGPRDYQLRAAREAARRGIPVCNPDLQELWAQERGRVNASSPAVRPAAHPQPQTRRFDPSLIDRTIIAGRDVRRDEIERLRQQEAQQRQTRSVPAPAN